MSRPRSDERRNAILAAATHVIAAQGVGAATATIAREAGVSNGSLFLYFDTKTTLVNELFIALKTEMGAAALADLPDADIQQQFHHMWTHWLAWATTYPEKRRAIAQLDVMGEVTRESHQAIGRVLAPIADLLERSRAGGPMTDASLGFVLAITTAIAEATIDAIINQPESTDAHSAAGFDAMWRVLAAPTAAKESA